MTKTYILILLISFNFFSFSQYCVTGVGPTSLIDSNIESVSLTGDVGMINYTGCPSVLGLEDQTVQNTTLPPSNSYILNVQLFIGFITHSAYCSYAGWTQKAIFPNVGRHRAASFAIGNKGYVGIGHANGTGTNIVYNDWWEFDPASNYF